MAIAAATITLPRPLAGHPFRETRAEPVQRAVQHGGCLIKEGGALLAEYRVLEGERFGQDECRAEIEAPLGQRDMAMEALELRALIYGPAEIVLAGVFATLDRINRCPGCRRR